MNNVSYLIVPLVPLIYYKKELKEKSEYYMLQLKEYIINWVINTMIKWGYGEKKNEYPIKIKKVKLIEDKNGIIQNLTYYQNEEILEIENDEIKKVDIEYIYNGQMYTILDCKITDGKYKLPDYSGVVLPKQIYISAIIKDSDLEINVTDEVNKYLGPKNDFHKKEITPKDLFPNYKSELEVENWTLELRFVKRNKEQVYEYKINEKITLSEKITEEISTKSTSDNEIEICVE